MNQTVLLVEDNEKLNAINRRALENTGYTVLTALTLAGAREHLAAHQPDVILLDIVLPDGDGVDFCDEIRELTDAHILFLTSKREHEDKIKGFVAGGDDYITKPYKLEEMLARVAAVMRRRGAERIKPPAQTITAGPLMLDTVAMRAYLNGADMLLTPKEYAILLLLAQNEGETVSKTVLYETVWKSPLGGNANAIWRQISSLKKKLEASDKLVLHASRGDGYSLEILK